MNRIQTNFDHAVHTYPLAATVQHQAGDALIQQLKQHDYAHVLDLGCGTGITTQKLATALSYDHFEAQDFSPASLAFAKSHCLLTQVIFIEADFDKRLGEQKPDLIFSNMALHWSTDLRALLKKSHERLNPGGTLLFTVPLANTFHELRGRVRQKTLPSLSEMITLLKQTHFNLVHDHVTEYRTQHKHLRAALHSIKQTGAHTADKHPTQALTKTSLRSQTPLELTYEIGFFNATKPHTRTP